MVFTTTEWFLQKRVNYEKEEKVLQIIAKLHTHEIQLNKDNSLFRFESKKRTDSFIMDYIHGSSFIFGNIRGLEDGNKLCYFCNSMEDSPEHQLVECKEIQDDTHKQLVDSCMTSGHIGEILCNILAPHDSANQIQKSFIERVAFLMEQHDFMEELVP